MKDLPKIETALSRNADPGETRKFHCCWEREWGREERERECENGGVLVFFLWFFAFLLLFGFWDFIFWGVFFLNFDFPDYISLCCVLCVYRFTLDLIFSLFKSVIWHVKYASTTFTIRRLFQQHFRRSLPCKWDLHY